MRYCLYRVHTKCYIFVVRQYPKGGEFMILAEKSQSLQSRIEKQLYILKKAALVDDVFNETIKLIEDMQNEINNGLADINRFNAIAIKLEKEVERLKKQRRN